MNNRIIVETPEVIELKKLLEEAVKVIRYSESQFRYIYYDNGFDEWFETVKNRGIVHHNKEDLRISYSFGSIHESIRRDKQCKALEEENQKSKERLTKAVERLQALKESFWSSSYGEKADELSKADEFLKTLEEK